VTLPESSELMREGIALLEESSPESLREAVALFDRALAIRTRLLVPGDAWLGYVTAASWMNRAEALTRLGAPGELEEALRSYDEALAVLALAPGGQIPLYRRREAIAWLNRGMVLRKLKTGDCLDRAIASFERAIAVPGEETAEAGVLAGAWLNRGAALLELQPARPAEARACALATLRLTAPAEETDAVAAETGLKGRQVLCLALAGLLATAPETAPEWSSEATDAVEAGLALARAWQARGETRFHSLQLELFRFGLVAYQKYQPGFLAEYLLDQVQPAAGASLRLDGETRDLALRVLGTAAAEFQLDGFASLTAKGTGALFRALRAIEVIRRIPEMQK
jgi:hypothetical protein